MPSNIVKLRYNKNTDTVVSLLASFVRPSTPLLIGSASIPQVPEMSDDEKLRQIFGPSSTAIEVQPIEPESPDSASQGSVTESPSETGISEYSPNGETEGELSPLKSRRSGRMTRASGTRRDIWEVPYGEQEGMGRHKQTPTSSLNAKQSQAPDRSQIPPTSSLKRTPSQASLTGSPKQRTAKAPRSNGSSPSNQNQPHRTSASHLKDMWQPYAVATSPVVNERRLAEFSYVINPKHNHLTTSLAPTILAAPSTSPSKQPVTPAVAMPGNTSRTSTAKQFSHISNVPNTANPSPSTSTAAKPDLGISQQLLQIETDKVKDEVLLTIIDDSTRRLALQKSRLKSVPDEAKAWLREHITREQSKLDKHRQLLDKRSEKIEIVDWISDLDRAQGILNSKRSALDINVLKVNVSTTSYFAGKVTTEQAADIGYGHILGEVGKEKAQEEQKLTRVMKELEALSEEE